MQDQYLEASGQLIDINDVRIPKAVEMVQILQSGALAFVELAESRRLEDPAADVIVFDVEVEVGQRTLYDIRHQERLAVTFYADDAWMPETIALRPDFPLVPHLNLKPYDIPRSLCLYDEPYDEVKMRWTAKRFLERIRTWLALTARGELHAPDQPLEPLLPGSLDSIVLPINLFVQGQPTDLELLYVQGVQSENDRITLIASQQDAGSVATGEHTYVATSLLGAPQQHGIISRQPRTLFDLHQFLLNAQINLLAELRLRLRRWRDDASCRRRLNARLIFIIYLPKSRHEEGGTEGYDFHAFLCSKTVLQIGEVLGEWQIQRDGSLAAIIGAGIDQRAEEVDLVVLNPMPAFSRQLAAIYNGLAEPDTTTITAVGLGALGSQVFSILARMGYGLWNLIDKDVMLPHNQARHALYDFAIGGAKSGWMASLASSMLNERDAAKPIVADILNPGDKQQDVEAALTQAQVILDMSADIPVARHLALNTTSQARRLSLFLNPTGTDLVLLAEDAQRSVRLDSLEMQYYRRVLNDANLDRHLDRGSERVHYARSCRDVSGTIPADLVAMHASVGSRAVRLTIADNSAKICIWQYHNQTFNLNAMILTPASMIEYKLGEWTLCTDQVLLEKIAQTRLDKLPNETGGVLLGSFDLSHKQVYVVDIIPSPPDSTEWPTSYIRGRQGLSERVSEISKRTAGMVEYIGEWHSHPRGYSCSPSADDRRAFGWLIEHMNSDGLPGLMLIAGDDGNVAWYLNEMEMPGS